MLNLKVIVESDKELRDYIKDLIKGQIQSLSRKDIRKLLEEIISKEELEKWLHDEIRKAIVKNLSPSGTSYRLGEGIRNMTEKAIKDAILENLEISVK